MENILCFKASKEVINEISMSGCLLHYLEAAAHFISVKMKHIVFEFSESCFCSSHMAVGKFYFVTCLKFDLFDL